MNQNIRRTDYRHRASQRRRQRFFHRLPLILIIILLLILLTIFCWMLTKHFLGEDSPPTLSLSPTAEYQTGTDNSQSPVELEISTEPESTGNPSVNTLLAEAERVAAGYDYDRAIELLQASEFYGTDQRLDEAIADYEQIKSTLKPFDINQITHVFFHTLVIDEAKAFDGDEDEAGYNQVMTTKDEFLKMLDALYAKGYVLVRLHDMAELTDGENGTKMTRKQILLPEGKKAFVMSQDDVCYYKYMTGDGFATRMVIGEDGKPTCEMQMDDGTIQTGAFDLVPILEEYIQEHPDFSYKGARAVIAFTGYEGILGYRTAPSYSSSPTYEEDKQAAAAVAQCLRDNGWELASHSWGHRDLGTISWDKFKADCDKWDNEVRTLIGPTDIILFPFGADIGDWHPYKEDNERFRYLKGLGFSYFCNVDSSQYWVQIGSDFLRQGRRNLDGYRMWMDIAAGSDTSKRKLDDLFRSEDIFSPNRPTPVVWE
ncbi:MAG: polysaccharide deacetylase [Hungatella sp.]|nr:polysaccharide deacetylase [Hungatella sp.]